MYKTTVNGKHKFDIEFEEHGETGKVNGEAFSLDKTEFKNGVCHVIHNNRSYNIEVVSVDTTTKEVALNVNNTTYHIEVKDDMDQLLERLGMDVGAAAAIQELKAPMPGLVVETRVKEGDLVKKGDALMVLEAMKMENVLKAPADVEVDKILVESGKTIEKNATLITFK